jgi:hypothetical protein
MGLVHKLDLSYCQKIIDVSALGSVHTLDLSYCQNIKDIGNLRELKKLVISEEILEIHLLKNLEKLTINKNCNKKMKRRIKKLKEINQGVKIEFV